MKPTRRSCLTAPCIGAGRLPTHGDPSTVTVRFGWEGCSLNPRLRCGVQKVQDIMLPSVQGVQGVQEVCRECRRCVGSAGSAGSIGNAVNVITNRARWFQL